jgi:hypothetical protein
VHLAPIGKPGTSPVRPANPDGRALAVERIGMECIAGREPRIAEVNLDEPIELPVDGPQRKVYTPLGPILAAGVVPSSTVRPFAVTTGERWWCADPQQLVMLVPPGVVPEHFAEDLGSCWRHRSRRPYMST